MVSPQSRIRQARFRQWLDQYQRPAAAPLRLVYIPTHRDCPEVLEAVVDEIMAASQRLTDEFQLVVIDDRQIEMAEGNRLSAEHVAAGSDVIVNWLGTGTWANFVDLLVTCAGLSGAESAAARSALVKPTGSYAAGMNKAALLASYLGAASLHRRDSDEFPAHDKESGVCTLEVEVTALGTELPTGTGEHAAPFVVGSSVEGESTKDHRDINEAGLHFGAELEAVSRRRRRPGEEPPVPVEGIIEVGPGLPVVRDYVGRVQVGVSASREVHHWIPEMPVAGVLGTDHFQKGLLYQLGLPVYWHPLSAYHKYEPWRADQADHRQLGRYVISELRYAVLRHYWNVANETVAKIGPGMFTGDGHFRSDVHADAFTAALTPTSGPAEVVADAFVDVYARAASAAADAVAERLQIRLKALRAERPRAVPYVRDAITEFAGLTRLWPQLVDAANLLGLGGLPGESI